MKCFNCQSELPNPADRYMVRCVTCDMEYSGDLLRNADERTWQAVIDQNGYRLELHDTEPPTATVYTVAAS